MNSIIQSTIDLINRDLDNLVEEINAYEHESDLWKLKSGINNSAGNLCLHVCGNLQHFIGAWIGGDGYIRNREDEFALKDVPRDQLLDEIVAARKSVTNALQNMPENQLDEIYPKKVLGKPMTHTYFLIHLTAHLNYHLGQINYHRRLIL